MLKPEAYDPNYIQIIKKGRIFSAKLFKTVGYSNFRSGDLSKFKFMQAKVKMIENKQKGSETPLLCGIQRLKSFNNNQGIYSSQEGIYFFHFHDKHIYGCSNFDIKTDLKFDSNGESLIIQVDRTNDLLSFIDDYNKKWSIKLSKVVGEDPFVFSFLMYQLDVEIQVQFY